jgi:uncharacterized protein
MGDLEQNAKKKQAELKKWFHELDGSIVAFSGGIDSSLVLFLARKYQGKERAIGVISRSESLKTKDFKLARSFSSQFDIHMEVIVTRELEDERYNENPIDRCFFCKDHLYNDLQTVREKFPGFQVLNGTNADDFSDYRPGMKAATKYEVRSPLAECNVSKEEIRQIALHYNLPNWDKPASPCLSSRIPYTHKITRRKLVEIERAEDLLNSFGFDDVRVRHYGDHGKVEVRKEDLPRLMELKESVVGGIREIGFNEVIIDEEGLVSGKMNRVIKNESGKEKPKDLRR